MIVTSIKEKERIFIFVGNIKVAFLMPHLPYFSNARFVNEQLDAISTIELSFKKYVTHKGKKVLNVILNTSIYGTVQAALLWCELHSITLMDLDFKLKLHDLFVVKKLK